jgi:UPF0755 protein
LEKHKAINNKYPGLELLKKLVLKIFISLCIPVTGILIVLSYLFFWPPASSKTPVVFKIKFGTPLSTIAAELQRQKIIRSSSQFEYTVKFFKKNKKIRAGQFTLHTSSSNYRVLHALTEGAQTFIRITIPEGEDSRFVASVLSRKLELDSLKIISLVQDASFCSSFGLAALSLEGYLYPETYLYNYGITEKQTISQLVNQFKKQVPDTLEQVAQKLGYSFQQMLTLASIIEGEAMLDVELPLISSVYHNRLHKGMLLQADPTIQYIIPDGPRRLLKRDLRIESPYNTYKYRGLPPGPINNPGIKAIQAACHPAKTNYLYFVANGDGSHSFSATLSEHLRAKHNFDKVRRAVAAEKRKSL